MSGYLSGHSDDCIEVGGDVREEFYSFGEDGDYVAFDNGLLFKIKYTGIWEISLLANPNNIEVKHEFPTGDGYTQKVTWEAPVKWVVLGRAFKK